MNSTRILDGAQVTWCYFGVIAPPFPYPFNYGCVWYDGHMGARGIATTITTTAVTQFEIKKKKASCSSNVVDASSQSNSLTGD